MRFVKIVFFLCIPLFVQVANAAGEFEVLRSSEGRILAVYPIGEVKADVPEDLVLSADILLRKLSTDKNLFVNDVTKQLRPVVADKDILGNTKIIFSQIHRDIDVSGKQVSVYFNKNGSLLMIKGDTNKDLNLEPEIRVSSKKAIDLSKNITARSLAFIKARRTVKAIERRRCKRSKNTSKAVSSCVTSKLKKFEELTLPTVSSSPNLSIKLNATGKDAVVWELSLNKGEDVNEIIQIDARTGEVISQALDMDTATEVRPWVYDCGHNLPSADSCYVNYFTTTAGVEFILGRSFGQPPRGASPMPAFIGSTDVDHYFATTIPALHNFYSTKFGRNGANNYGGTVVSNGATTLDRSQFGVNANRTTVGVTECSRGYPSAWRSTFGVQVCMNARSHDLIAHEYGHIVTLALSRLPNGNFLGLDREGQAGTLDESFCDIMGESYEHSMSGSNDWHFFPESGEVSRNFADPSSNTYTVPNGPTIPNPDRYHSPNFYCGTWNFGGKHLNATVPNKAFYLMSQGGDFNGCQIDGIGILKAQQVWYRALATYFSPTETFNDAVVSAKRACQDFVENPSYLATQTPPIVITADDCKQVEKALQAVEMDLASPCVNLVNVGNDTPPNCLEVSQPVTGDVNGDENVDLEDLHAILLKWSQNAANLPEDLNANGTVDLDDYNIWHIAYYIPGTDGILPPAPVSSPTLSGDCNGDKSVDGSDFMAWQRNFGTTGPALFCDFNLDRIVDGLDLDLIKSNYGNSLP